MQAGAPPGGPWARGVGPRLQRPSHRSWCPVRAAHRVFPMTTGLRATPPPSSFAEPGARCILGKGPAPSSRSPWGSGWVLCQRVTGHPPESVWQQTGSMGSCDRLPLPVWGSSCWESYYGAGRWMEVPWGWGARRTLTSSPLRGSLELAGNFSLWAVGRGPPWRSEWGPQSRCPPESSRWSVAVLSLASVQGAQKDPRSRHELPGGGWFLPSWWSANLRAEKGTG